MSWPRSECRRKQCLFVLLLVRRTSIRLLKNYLKMVEIGNLLTTLEGLVMEIVLR